MKIRPFIPELAEKMLSSTENSYKPALSDFLRFPNRLHTATSGENILGWLYLSIPEDKLGSCFVYIYVAPDHRCRGIGRALYEHADKAISSTGLERWSSYLPSETADKFAMSMGFDYTNTNSCMEYSSAFTSFTDPAIRPYEDGDYPAAPDIWTDEYTRMHISLGLPYTPPERTDEWRAQERAEYLKNADYTFVIEEKGRVVGIGSMFDDNSGIGALAVDSKSKGKGHGERLARFMTAECIRRGCKTPRLYCETNNKPAFRLYHKIGYREISRETVAIKK